MTDAVTAERQGALQLYDTRAQQLRVFAPLDPGNVTVYVCGPTVQSGPHIGHLRGGLAFDILRRWLAHRHGRVTFVRNVTDIDDKVLDNATESEPWWALAYRVEQEFAAAYAAIGILPPTYEPRATGSIPQMIALIERLIEDGNAYVGGDGAVYFSVASFPAYGRLSGNTVDALRAGEGGRVSSTNQAAKRHPADFLLWKPDPSHLMRWASPWGEGYPGWHLECSAMAQGLLAADEGPHAGQIDLHSGGEDNIFPHHECEIAQSCAASKSERFARHWFHTRHLVVEGEKMSKSGGNFHTVRDILDRGVTPAALRLELVRTHYRQNANFTMQGLRDCGRMVDRWCRLRDRLVAGRVVPGEGPGPLESALAGFEAAVSDDLNLARAIGVLNEAANASRLDDDAESGSSERAAAELAALLRMDGILGVLDRNVVRASDAEAGGLTAEIESKIAARTEAKARKDWAAADAMRDELAAMGIAIKDGPDGTTWTRIVE